MKNRNSSSRDPYVRAAGGAGSAQRIALAVCAALGAAQAAAADSEQPAALEEIVVTAQRREQSVQDVPVSISAYGRDQLDTLGVRAVDDIKNLAPGLYFNRSNFGSGLGSNIAIRGVYSIAGAATTGVYIDDTPIQARSTIASGNFSSNAYPKLFDVERVEVLRGPQGTLFGAGSEGGTIRFITPAPSLTATSVYARSEVSYTSHGDASYEAGLAVGAPIVQDKLGFRASAWYRRDGGFVDRYDFLTLTPVDKKSNRERSRVARFALAFAPVDGLVITPSFLYQRIEVNNASIFWVPNEQNGFVQPLSDPDKGVFQSGQRLGQPGEQTVKMPALKIDWDFGPARLVSNTSYYQRDDRSITDFTNFETPLWTGIFAGQPVYNPPDPTWKAIGSDSVNNKFLTQEVRLQSKDGDSRLSWVAGVFYSKSDIGTLRAVNNTFLPTLLSTITHGACSPANCYQAFFGVPAAQGIYIFYGDTRTHDKQKALFGQVDYKVTDNLTATVGVRYSKLDFDFTNYADGPVNGPPAPRVEGGSQRESATTPKFGVSYKLNGAMIYASASKGFRPGGANVPLNNPACKAELAADNLVDPISYNSDSLWAYELGTKFGALDHRLQVDASVFRINWKNIINNVSLQCILSFTTNLGEASSTGADLDVQFRATQNLLLSAQVGYADAHYTTTIGIPGTTKTLVSNGDGLFGSAWNGHLAAHYTFNVMELPTYAHVDFSYQGKNAPTVLNDPNNPGYDPTSQFRDPATTLTNVRLGALAGGWDISLFVNNLFDSAPLLQENRVAQGSPIISALTFRPRTIGVTGTYRF